MPQQGWASGRLGMEQPAVDCHASYALQELQVTLLMSSFLKLKSLLPQSGPRGWTKDVALQQVCGTRVLMGRAMSVIITIDYFVLRVL
jgi:hypothetical protein